jgi:uncharacterized protein
VAGASETTRADDADLETGPHRLCAVTRVSKPPEELIRFVQGPDGAIVPDLALRLPGRGVWVEATRSRVADAARRNVFAKSLKRSVSVPQDLPERIERLLQRRLADALSLANKAGLVVTGFTKVDALIAGGEAFALLHAADGAADGIAKLNSKFRALRPGSEDDGAIIRELTSAEMSLALGRPNVVHAAASEGGASRRIAREAGRLRRFRTG